MVRATYNGQVIAESDQTVVVEGNYYFPPDSLRMEFFEPSDTTTVCGWKGTANYYNVVVDGRTITDAAWVYHDPSEAARQIKDYVAFWKDVQVQA